ncbi:MAG: glycine cleavage system aminomethyltransferase GcvT [Zoogloeaceae bacterium]|jgi:aminomethyltransferase|nr:glycine cleavage system aminomethyltransferase GcvT [Zoogloeaceae bacterium]
MSKPTVLNAAHRALNARMIDFGGWEMPVNYGSQIEEHHAVRRDCGMFDISHMCAVALRGPDARPFLSRLLANSVEKLQAPGKALYSPMLNETGGVIDDLIVCRFSDEDFHMVVNAGTAGKDLAWMSACRAARGYDVTLAPLREGSAAVGMIAVQGPNARARVWQALPETRRATETLPPFFGVRIGDLFIATTGYTGEDGFEITLPAARAEALWSALLAAGVRPCGLGARDTLRLEAGMNLYGQDMDETVSPLDAGLERYVELASGRDFIGRAALLAQERRVSFLGLKLLDKGVLRAHQKVFTPEGEGEITSGTFSPTLGASIAFARLPRAARINTVVQVDIRGKRLPARIVPLPFVRHGKALV